MNTARFQIGAEPDVDANVAKPGTIVPGLDGFFYVVVKIPKGKHQLVRVPEEAADAAQMQLCNEPSLDAVVTYKI